MAKPRRQPKNKKINPSIFVFCEGETEEAYIRMLRALYRLPSIHIKSKICGLDITNDFIQKYKQDKLTHEKDLDFLLYDMDVSNILERLKKINECTLLISNPCIELWFLLHFKNQKANVDCKYCLKELNNRNGNYKKGMIDDKLRKRLITRIDEAIKRAKEQNEIKNPYTNVYLLIEKLNELKSI